MQQINTETLPFIEGGVIWKLKSYQIIIVALYLN
jgi:hypothetical protein